MSLIFDFKDEFKLNVSLLLLVLFIFKAAICLVQNFLTSDGARHRWCDECQERNLTLPDVGPNGRSPYAALEQRHLGT